MMHPADAGAVAIRAHHRVMRPAHGHDQTLPPKPAGCYAVAISDVTILAAHLVARAAGKRGANPAGTKRRSLGCRWPNGAPREPWTDA